MVAKYKNNTFKMFTFDQLESLFKSRYKSLREGLLYLQTIVGKTAMHEIRVNIDTRQVMQNKPDIYERAKNEARIFLGEVKPSDMDFIIEADEVRYENELKRNNPRDYLEYLTLKIILIDSKNEPNIISHGTFKYILNRGIYYIWDVRVKQLSSSEEFWASGVMKAFEQRLQKRMSMMDLDAPVMSKSQTDSELTFSSLGKKAQDISVWLEKSTSIEWEQMKVIRNRLERLEKEKRSLMQSQSFAEGTHNKSFKIRSVISNISRRA